MAALCTLASATLLGSCREGDGPADPSANDPRIYFTSSPNGAEISIDGRSTGQVTPDTVAVRRGDRVLGLELDSAGYTYAYDALIEVARTDTVLEARLPLGLQCGALSAACITAARRHYNAAGLRFAGSAVGTLLYWDGSGQGLIWPGTSLNSYASSGMPVVAGHANETAVALGLYDQSMLVGRPAPRVTTMAGEFRLTQQAWVLPPLTSLVRPTTVRGILIDEEITAYDDLEGVLIVRLTFRNVSEDSLVHTFAPHIPTAPVTYTDTWIGFMIDPDIGAPGDDWLSYDADLDMVFAYDANFTESEFIGEGSGAPGLIGLRVLRAPEGAEVLLNSWSLGSDWSAGMPSEPAGFGMLTGSAIFSPEHVHPEIGYLPADSRDVRLSVTAGPLTIAPGAEAEIVIAIAVASPTSGTFTSGVEMEPGDPLDTNRPLYDVAAGLRARMIAAGTRIAAARAVN